MTISQILFLYSAENLRELAKEIYDLTSCGAWITFITPKGEIPSSDLTDYQNKKPWAANNVIGIRLGSIVEGSDAEIAGETLYCGTFDENDLQEEINRIEKLADEIWWENDLTKEACDFYSNSEFAQSEVDNG
jgi:hypothetical protein